MCIPPDILRSRVEMLETSPLREYARLVIEQALAPGASPKLRRWVSRMIERNDKRA